MELKNLKKGLKKKNEFWKKKGEGRNTDSAHTHSTPRKKREAILTVLLAIWIHFLELVLLRCIIE